VIGQSLKMLDQHGELVDGKFRWKIPFTVGMDQVTVNDEPVTEEKIQEYAARLHPDLSQRRAEEQGYILKMVEQYLRQKTMTAQTFELYGLKGTPSSILVDREGILRDVSFGPQEGLEQKIQKYLA
jgi:hypothetical protein